MVGDIRLTPVLQITADVKMVNSTLGVPEGDIGTIIRRTDIGIRVRISSRPECIKEVTH